eukprot:Em0001g1909a
MEQPLGVVATVETAEAPSSDHRISVWNGYQLAVTKWRPQSSPKVLLCISHGVGEHMGRYDKLGKYLAEKGVLVYGHDHVGHGNSQGDRVYVNSFNTYVQDTVRHIEDMNKQHPEVPSMLLGHSMGGLVATLVVEQNQSLVSALLLSSPGLDTDPAFGSFTYTVLQMVIAVIKRVLPQKELLTLDPNFISTIPEEVQMYVEDPLVWHGGMKAGWIYEFGLALTEARANIRSITLPLFLMHGDGDRLVPISASEFIRANIGSQDKQYEVFADNYHEILHDKDQDRAMQLIADWILANSN